MNEVDCAIAKLSFRMVERDEIRWRMFLESESQNLRMYDQTVHTSPLLTNPNRFRANLARRTSHDGMRAKRKNSIPVENRVIVQPSERGYKSLSGDRSTLATCVDTLGLLGRPAKSETSGFVAK